VFLWGLVSFVMVLGINIEVVGLGGGAVGAGELHRTGEGIAAGFLLGSSFSGCLGLVFVVFRDSLLRIFSVEGQDFSAILAVGGPMMVGMATYVVADAVLLVCSGVLRGAGDTQWLMKTSIAVHIAMLLVQILVIVVWKLGALTSWYVFVATINAQATLYLIRVLNERWKAPERIAAVLAE